MDAQDRIPGSLSGRVKSLRVCMVVLAGVFGGLLITLAQNSENAEIATYDSQPGFQFKVQRNVVLVRAVVRDSKGRPVGGLKKEDFRVFDDRKVQEISDFAVEGPDVKGAVPAGAPTTKTDGSEDTAGAGVSATMAQRYTGLFFDDVHIEFGDLARTREAADRYLATALTAGDRVGIFTASGRDNLDFTDDRAKLHATLQHLFTYPIVPEPADDACPQISDYQAYLIVHQRDPFALEAAGQEAYYCQCESLSLQGTALQQCQMQSQGQAEAAAVQVLNRAETKAEYPLRGLRELVRRMSVLPGQRAMVLISPGFLTLLQQTRVNEISDQALRHNIIINALDAKGLYAPVPLGDASKRPLVIPRHPEVVGHKVQFELDRLQRAVEVLRNLAEDTGGTFFHNSNDYDEGFRRVGAFPRVYYLLAFSPKDLKLDGRFHNLKVSLVSSAGLSIQARRGYFAPSKALDRAEEAKEEIQEALFSQDEMSQLPIHVHTQFFKTDGTDAKLSVLTHVDLRLVRFRKSDGRNLDNLTVVAALFDRDGKYVTSQQKLLQLRLRDESLAKLAQSGITMKSSFDVKPGAYMVRLVVRDGESALTSALSRPVEIPY